MTQRPDLRSTWAKIERAEMHRQELERRIDAHLAIDANMPTAVSKFDPKTSCYVFRIDYVPASLPDLLLDVRLSVGDIAHNLRSALDHLAYQLALDEARRKGIRLPATELESIAFPIHTRRRGSWPRVGWANRENAYIRRFGKDNAAVIKNYQPYRGRAGRSDTFAGRYQHQLTLLRDLSNRDKHRLLPVIAALPHAFLGFFPPRVTLDVEGRCGNAYGDRVELGAVVAYAFVVGQDNGKMDMNAEIPPVIDFPKRGSVLSTMDRVLAFTYQIVGEFGDPP